MSTDQSRYYYEKILRANVHNICELGKFQHEKQTGEQ